MIKLNEFLDEPIENYHDGEGFSKTQLSLFLDCPATFHRNVIEPIAGQPVRTETPAQKLGTAVHTIVLEPEEYDDRYVIAPEINKRTKDGKQAWADFEETHKGKVVLTSAESDLIHQLNDALQRHPKYVQLVRNGRPEQSCYFKDEATGILLKCRPDYVHEGIVVDLKTAISVEPNEFSKACANFHYHLSVAITARGYKAATGQELQQYIFLGIQNKYPFNVAAYVLGPESIDLAEQQLTNILTQLKDGLSRNYWPSYTPGDEIVEIELPRWAFYK